MPISISFIGIPFDLLLWGVCLIFSIEPTTLKKGTHELDDVLAEKVYLTWQETEEMVQKGKVRNI
jgi:hypothetical protein